MACLLKPGGFLLFIFASHEEAKHSGFRPLGSTSFVFNTAFGIILVRLREEALTYSNEGVHKSLSY
jgi:hypothetical protein